MRMAIKFLMFFSGLPSSASGSTPGEGGDSVPTYYIYGF
jgi:hypothetical protein